MKTKVAIIGEVCQDEYIYGTCNRVCPEAAALCFVHDNQKSINLGMAGNVKANFDKLDINRQIIDTKLISPRSSIIKRRFVDTKYNTILFREDIHDNCERIDINKYSFNDFSYLIISDYNKGFLEEEDIISICSKNKNHATIFIDTKKQLKNIAPHVHFIKINSFEFSSNIKDFEFIKDKTSLIVTKGEAGATLYHKHSTINYPTQKILLRDVCGAGDTFLASLVYKHIETQNIDISIKFANDCAAIVVAKFGVSTI